MGRRGEHGQIRPQTMAVLNLLRTRTRGITSLTALRELGVARLASRIHELRDAGYRIDVQRIAVPVRGGRTSYVALYRLVQ